VDGDFTSNGLLNRTGVGTYSIKVIGTDVQAWGAVLDDLNTLGANTADSEFLVGTAAGALAWESGATARTSIGLGTGDSPTFAGLTLSGNIAMSDGGKIGSNVQLEFDDTNNYLTISNGRVSLQSNLTGSVFSLLNSTYGGRMELSDQDTPGHAERHILAFKSNLAAAGYVEIFGYKYGTDVGGRDIIFNYYGGKIGVGAVLSPPTKLSVAGTISLKEQAAADGDRAGWGQLWVKNTAPCELWFTRDDGTDVKVV